VGGRDRLRQLGAVPPQVHRLAPGGDLRDPRDFAVDHMAENMGALYGRLPDAALRKRMISYVESL